MSESRVSLDIKIRRLVRDRPELFVEAGQYLDEHYSHAALIHKNARAKLADYRGAKAIHGEKRNSLTRAHERRRGWKRGQGPFSEPLPDPQPLQRDEGGLTHPTYEKGHRHCDPARFADGRRKPKSACDRHSQAMGDVLNELLPGRDDWMIDDDEAGPAVRTEEIAPFDEGVAHRILLLEWLMVDSTANEFPTVLTREFQLIRWQWPNTVTPADGTLESYVMRMDEHAPRWFWWRFRRDNRCWSACVEKAWSVVDGDALLLESTATATGRRGGERGSGQSSEGVNGSDKSILTDAIALLDHLTALIDELHEADGGLYEQFEPREAVIHHADGLCKQGLVNHVRDTLDRQGMLTGERKDDLANLSQSLDYIARVLRVSRANSWGDRFTLGSNAPQEVVQEWHGHWRTVRHIAVKLMHWAAAMSDDGGGSETVDQRDANGFMRQPADRPDESGYVECPADPSAYVSASQIIANHCDGLGITMTPKMLGEAVENYKDKGIRWTRPRSKKTGEPMKNRRCIHLGDWLKYVERFSGEAGDKGGWPHDPDEGEIERRKNQVRSTHLGK